LHYYLNPLECFQTLYHDVEDHESAYTPICLFTKVVSILKTNQKNTLTSCKKYGFLEIKAILVVE